MPPLCEPADSLRVSVEKKESLGFDGTYGATFSASSTGDAIAGDDAPLGWEEALLVMLFGVVGDGLGLSGVEAENLELMLFSHDDRRDKVFPSVTFSELFRLRRPGRFEDGDLGGMEFCTTAVGDVGGAG